MDTLLNWLWQGIAVAAAATIVPGIVRLRSSEWKYRFWWASMTIVLVLPAIAVALWTPLPSASRDAPGAIEAVYLPDVHVSDIPLVVMAVIAAWVSWIAVHVIRTFVALLALRRIRTRCTAFPAGREARLNHWTTLTWSKKLPLLVSDDVRSAAVIGLRAPVIAVSPRLLDGLTDEQLDRVLVHEWSHIRRRDHVVHAVQLLIRIVAGCHPAVWWIGRRLEAERESACDEMTIRVTGSPKEYAACLARLAEISHVRSRSLPVPAAVSCGVRSRIVRVLTMNGQSGERRLPIKVAASAAGVLLVAFQAGSSALVLPAVGAAASLVKALPEAESPTPAQIRTDDGVSPVAGRAGGPRPRGSAPQALRTPEPRAPELPRPEVPSHELPGREFQASDQPAGLESLPLTAALDMNSMAQVPVSTAPPAPQEAPEAATTWGAAKDAGVAIGRGSQKAAVSTAGFFTRFGKKIAGSF